MAETIRMLFEQISSVEFWLLLLSHFKNFGPLAPILLAFAESVFPMLPLLAIVAFNMTAYGTVLGFFYSWLGTVIGSFCMFTFYRKLVRPLVSRWLHRFQQLDHALEWVASSNRKILFVLACLPFTPSSFLNFAYGLSEYDAASFLKTAAAAKFFMVLSLILFGNTLQLAIQKPLYWILAGFVLVMLYLLSKWITNKAGLK